MSDIIRFTFSIVHFTTTSVSRLYINEW
jgi:hypothetical protein